MTAKGTPITAAEKALMVRMYVTDRMSVRAIAEATSRGYYSVWLVLDRAKVQMRGSGRAPIRTEPVTGRVHRIPLSVEEVAEAARLYRIGKSLVEVGQAMGRDTSTIRRALENAGVERRRSGPRIRSRHWCGEAARHSPHVGCNGFGLFAGPETELCTRTEQHPPHVSCDGYGQ